MTESALESCKTHQKSYDIGINEDKTPQIVTECLSRIIMKKKTATKTTTTGLLFCGKILCKSFFMEEKLIFPATSSVYHFIFLVSSSVRLYLKLFFLASSSVHQWDFIYVHFSHYILNYTRLVSSPSLSSHRVLMSATVKRAIANILH